MTLAELYEGRFRGDIRFRGATYLEAERVSIIRVTPDNLFAVIRDGNGECNTQLSRVNDQLSMFCNCRKCSKSQSQELSCKYLWATLLAVDEGHFLSGEPRPGHVPPFVVEQDPFEISYPTNHYDAEEEEDEADHAFTPTPTVTKKKPQAPSPNKKPLRQLRDWEQKLKNLRGEMRPKEPATQAAQKRDREIFYEIDIKESLTARQLVIQTSQRQRRVGGQWGKLKPLRLRSGQLEEIDHSDDRKILAYLMGGMPERNNWLAQQAEASSSVFRYHIPFELCELILPLMCATDRVRILDTKEQGNDPLQWDDEAPWELTLRVVWQDEKHNWRLKGELHRGDKELPFSKTVLMVPGGLVVTETGISRLRDYDAFDWVRLMEHDGGVDVPEGDEHELVDRLLDMPVLPRLQLPEELKLEEIQCDPKPSLVIRSPQSVRWQLDRLQGEVFFDYLGTPIPGSSTQWAIVQREQSRCLLRNSLKEEEAWSQLQEKGFRRFLDHRNTGSDVEIAARELGPAVRQLIAWGWDVRADGKQIRQAGEMQFRVKSDIDWFELHADVDFDGQTVTFPELLSALSRGDTTIRLGDGSLGILPEEWLQQYGLFAGLGERQEEHLRFSKSQVSLLDALLSSQAQVSYDDKFQEMTARFRSFSGVEISEEPKSFQGTLRTYQREGLGWLKFLQEFSFGGCLADDMGLGKTVQVLALMQERRLASPTKLPPALIVVPKSLLFNWEQEAHRFTPELNVMQYIGLNREELQKDFQKQDLILTTYGTLRRDILQLKDQAFDYVVLDEAQTIKNSSSQVAKACRLLEAGHRVALSGTPIENHLGDLWSIFEFLNPNMLGRSSVFKSYVADIEDEQSRKMLAAGLRPFILRRTKQQVASELPEKIEQTIYCDMTDEQQKLYDELRDHYRQSLLGSIQKQGFNKTKMHVLEALLRLRQAACHPHLLDHGAPLDASAKLDALVPLLEELISEGHKALVFSQFTSMLAIVKQHLDKNNIVYEYLDGQTRDRQERVERFQGDKDCGVFLVSLKAGGLGLNLTAADYVFLLDPWWNPAVEAQAIDRAHRVGQTRKVFAYRLICKSTVEEKIAELQQKKRTLADAILEADNTSFLKELSSEDLELLLS